MKTLKFKTLGAYHTCMCMYTNSRAHKFTTALAVAALSFTHACICVCALVVKCPCTGLLIMVSELSLQQG